MTTPRALLQSAYAALDEMVFATHDELPALNRRYEAAFAGFVSTVRVRAAAPKMDRCEHCLTWHPVTALAALDTEHTSLCVGKVWSHDRDVLFCKACRSEFEDEFGRWPNDGVDDAFERHYDR